MPFLWYTTLEMIQKQHDGVILPRTDKGAARHIEEERREQHE